MMSPRERRRSPSLVLSTEAAEEEDTMDNYKVVKALGQGTWGVVHMAEQKKTGRIVAVKKIKSERPELGVNFTAVREIKLLREFKHPNVIITSTTKTIE